MHELPYKPPDYGSSEGTSLFPCRPTVKHRSHSLQRRSDVPRAIVAVAPFVCHRCFRALRASRAHRPYRKRLPSGNYGLRRGGHTIAGQRAG
jgi:hypothetical protein